jgi:hypothetical protein
VEDRCNHKVRKICEIHCWQPRALESSRHWIEQEAFGSIQHSHALAENVIQECHRRYDKHKRIKRGLNRERSTSLLL